MGDRDRHGDVGADATLRAELTRREIDVLHRVAVGERNRDIATALRISTRTVEVHVSHILQKLGVTSRAAAIGQALRAGVVALDDLT